MNALEYAINMEIDGENYYSEQAKLNHHNSLEVVCLLLAKAEHNHAQLLQNKAAGLTYELSDDDSYSKIKNVFKDAGDFKSDIKVTPNQLDFYRTALEKEKQSIELYTNLLSNAADAHEKALFNFLIEQENQHFSILDEMVTMLRHAEEWVESAEFGLRNETY